MRTSEKRANICDRFSRVILLGEINSPVRRATLINSSRAPLVFITGCSSQNRGTAENALAANSSKQTPGAKKAAGEYNNQRASPENMCCWRELLGSGFVPAPAPAQQHAIRSPASVYICILITAGHDKRERENGRMGRRTHSQVHINPIAQFCVHGLARLVQMKTHRQTEEALVCCFCERSLACVFCTKGGVGCKHTEVKIKARFGDLMIVHYETTAVVSFHLL